MVEKFVSIFPGNYRPYLQNAFFDPTKTNYYWIRIFAHVRNFLAQNNIEINTCDISPKKKPFRYVYLDLPYLWTTQNFPVWRKIFMEREKNVLLCLEPPTVIPYNYMKIFHLFFKKVYTWNDQLVDNKKYFNLRLPKHTMGINIHKKKFNDKIFLTLINANKSPFYPFVFLSPFGNELYSERIKAIEFFEKTIPRNFFLYGKGWNKPKKYSLTEKFLGFKKYSTYKGEVEDKIKVLSNFKYCICFENLTNANGYISEKILDCFKARCVPIYWGASNIEKYIPKECFIDFRKFNDYKLLLDYLESIDEIKYNSYLTNIEKLLADKHFAEQWFEDGFARFFLEDVLEIKTKHRPNKN